MKKSSFFFLLKKILDFEHPCHSSIIMVHKTLFSCKARGQVLGEDGIRVHSLVLPGLPSGTTVYFSGPGEVRLLVLFSYAEVFT